MYRKVVDDALSIPYRGNIDTYILLFSLEVSQSQNEINKAPSTVYEICIVSFSAAFLNIFQMAQSNTSLNGQNPYCTNYIPSFKSIIFYCFKYNS